MATSFQDDYIKTALRLPRDLHAQLMEASKEQGKSFNSELIERLRQSFGPNEGSDRQVFESVGLMQEIERLNKILEAQEVKSKEALEAQGRALAEVAMKHLYAEAGETIEAARKAAEELRAAGKWSIKKDSKK